MNGYIVSQNEKSEWYIECLNCHRRSFNFNDIMMRYCGYCHSYHVDQPADTTIHGSGNPYSILALRR